MAISIGQVLGPKTGRDVRVIANGRYDRAKGGGVTLDVATIAAVTGSPATLADDTVVPVGSKYLRFGQILCKITASGLFGPYDSAAADGRQTLARGDCFFLDKTWLDVGSGVMVPQGQGSIHVAGFYGGDVWRERLLITTGTASLAAGPTVAAFEAAFPQVHYYKN
jgi:hypothetical protein